jgi:hypothetical protein
VNHKQLVAKIISKAKKYRTFRIAVASQRRANPKTRSGNLGRKKWATVGKRSRVLVPSRTVVS